MGGARLGIGARNESSSAQAVCIRFFPALQRVWRVATLNACGWFGLLGFQRTRFDLNAPAFWQALKTKLRLRPWLKG